MSVTNFLNSKGFTNFEGNIKHCEPKVKDFIDLIKSSDNIHIMEIGFNAGHSAEIILKNNSKANLTSFDLGSHNYVGTAKQYIDNTYPDRHNLIIGNSTQTIPIFIQNNPDKKFDIIFIDGGHDYNIAKADLENCYHLAHKDTIVIIDDTIYTAGWEKNYSIGPTKTWVEHIKEKKIIELNRKDYSPGYGMSWGKYVL
jgi:predicted O-methyltransferase YrrM